MSSKNTLTFDLPSSDFEMSFAYSGTYCCPVTLESVETGTDGNQFKIIVTVSDRTGSDACASSFNKDTLGRMVHSGGGGNTPDGLNFWVLGTLTLQGQTFDNVYIGQGNYGSRNNWWLGSQELTYVAGDHKSANLGAYEIKDKHMSTLSIEVSNG